MTDNDARDINPDDYKHSGKISRLFSRLAGSEFRSSTFIVGRPHFRLLRKAQLIAKERVDGEWDVIKKTTDSVFTFRGWSDDGQISLAKLFSGLSKEAALCELETFEQQHQRALDARKTRSTHENKLKSLFG